MYRQQHSVPRAPNQKVQPRPVPQPAQEHRDQHIQIHPMRPGPRTAQGNEYVINQPLVQRHVPMFPKFGNVQPQIRPIKILGHFDAEQPSGANRNVRVSGKIEVDFHAVSQQPNRQDPPLGLRDVRPVQMIRKRGQKIGDYKFLN